jgi:hypothetical protein
MWLAFWVALILFWAKWIDNRLKHEWPGLLPGFLSG